MRLGLSVLVVLLCAVSFAQNLANVTKLRFNAQLPTSLESVDVDKQNNFAVTGAAGSKLLVAFYDRIGNPIWQKTVKFPVPLASGRIVKFDSDGNILVLALEAPSFSESGNSVVVKLDRNGNVVFIRRIDLPFTEPSAMIVDQQDSVIVTGGFEFSSTFVFKVTSNGDIAWVFTEPVPSSLFFGSDVCVDSSGDVYLVHTDNLVNSQDAVVRKLSGVSGTEQFQRAMGASGFPSRGAGILFGSNGLLYVGGSISAGSGASPTLGFVARLSTLGSVQEVQSFGGGNNQVPQLRQLLTDGSNLYYCGLRGSEVIVQKLNLDLDLGFQVIHDPSDFSGALFDLVGTSIHIRTRFRDNTVGFNKLRLRKISTTDGVSQAVNDFGFGVGFDLRGQALAHDGEANVYLVGRVDNFGENQRGFVRKLKSNYQVFWTQRVDHFGPVGGSVLKVVVDPSGFAYVLGRLDSARRTGYVAKVDRSGQIVWSALLGFDSTSIEFPSDIEVLKDGNVVVVAQLQHGSVSPRQFDMLIVKLSAATGARIWTQVFDNSQGTFDTPSAVDVAGSGDIYVTGTSSFNLGGTDIALLRVSPVTGEVLWVRYFDNITHGSDNAQDVQVGPNGNIAVVGNADRSIVTILFSPSGRLLWTSFAFGDDANGFNSTRTLRIGSDNSVYVLVELENDNFPRNQVGFVRYRGTNGAEISRGFQEVVENFDFGSGIDLELNTFSNPVVLGSALDLTVTLFNKETGKINRTITHPSNTSAMTLDGTNCIYVCGSTNTSDLSLIKFSPSGAVLREFTFENAVGTSFGDSGRDVALGLAGDVWIAGESSSPRVGTEMYLLRLTQNVAPTSAPDTYEGTEDQVLSVAAVEGLLANDFDPNGDAMTARIVRGPGTAGTLSLNTDGSFTFTPKRNFHGPASFVYQAVDSGGKASTPTTVTINVTPVNDPPLAVTDSFSVAKGQVLDIEAPGVLVNDSDVDGDSLTAQLVAGSQIGGGSLVFRTDGSFTFTAPSVAGTTSFNYKAKDSSGALSVAKKVTITITD